MNIYIYITASVLNEHYVGLNLCSLSGRSTVIAWLI